MIENSVVTNVEEDQIDFGELFFTIKRGLWAIILFFVVGAFIAYSYTVYFIQFLYIKRKIQECIVNLIY